MAKIDAVTVERWRGMARDWLGGDGGPEGFFNRLSHVTTGREAWIVAQEAGICREAYAMSRDIHDAHIQTALESIFPNAVFRDKKRY